MPRTLTTFPMNQFEASRISRQWPGSTVISGKNIKDCFCGTGWIWVRVGPQSAKMVFLWTKEKAESAILSGPHAVQQLGRHLRVALKDLDFAAGWCRYWATAIVFFLGCILNFWLCCTLLHTGGFYIVVASQILVNIRMAVVGAPWLGNRHFHSACPGQNVTLRYLKSEAQCRQIVKVGGSRAAFSTADMVI